MSRIVLSSICRTQKHVVIIEILFNYSFENDECFTGCHNKWKKGNHHDSLRYHDTDDFSRSGEINHFVSIFFCEGPLQKHFHWHELGHDTGFSKHDLKILRSDWSYLEFESRSFWGIQDIEKSSDQKSYPDEKRDIFYVWEYAIQFLDMKISASINNWMSLFAYTTLCKCFILSDIWRTMLTCVIFVWVQEKMSISGSYFTAQEYFCYIYLCTCILLIENLIIGSWIMIKENRTKFHTICVSLTRIVTTSRDQIFANHTATNNFIIVNYSSSTLAKMFRLWDDQWLWWQQIQNIYIYIYI